MKKKTLSFLLLSLVIIFGLCAEDSSNPFVFDPSDTEGDKFYNEFLNMLSTLGLILVVMLIVAWIVKRFTQARLVQANISSSVKILESRPISNKTTLHLIEVEGTGYLLAEHVQGVEKIGQFELES